MTPADARNRLATLQAAATAAVEEELRRVAEAVAADARHRLGATSSQPGSPPADPGGRLADTIAVEGGTVRVDAPFAADLEYGTRRMTARPFLRPAVAATAISTRWSLADAVRKAFAAAFGEGP